MAQFRKDTHQYLNQEKTIFEVVMLADQHGNLVGPANPSGAAVDAFGRARTALPFTLFDSSHRYGDNGKFCTANTTGGTFGFIANTASVDLTVNTTSGASVYRETSRVFAYQPGKSLQILNTFVMNAAKTNLRQRVGYFSANNGYYLERSTATASGVSFVERSYVTGAIVNTPVDQANWNVDKLDGTGPSLLTLNLDDPQILFIDMEWLGVGSVRMGFVINGQTIICHRFDHANIDTVAKGAYIQTASLPVRYEIENTGVTGSSSTLKQVCSTVISEGGYELAGKPREIGQDPVAANQIVLGSAGTYYPVVSIRINPAFLDAIVIPKEISVLPISAANYRYKLISGATITGGVWANVTTDSTVQYNTNTTATMSGGNTYTSGYITSTVQGGGSVNLHDSLFKYQLERNSLANTTTTFTLAVTCGTNTSNTCGSISFEEVVY
jgi:hypothetical protein